MFWGNKNTNKWFKITVKDRPLQIVCASGLKTEPFLEEALAPGSLFVQEQSLNKERSGATILN